MSVRNKDSIMFVVICLLLLFSHTVAQSLPPVTSIEAHWPKDEVRQFVFVINDSIPLGTLKARLARVSSGDGGRLIFTEDLDLDFSNSGTADDIAIIGQMTLHGDGFFREADYDVTLGERRMTLDARFEQKESIVVGKWSGDARQTLNRDAAPKSFVAEDHMLHHLELMLADKELKPGERITVPVFSPTRMYSATYEFLVAGKTAVRYGPFADSVWQVDMVSPGNQKIFIDQKHQLVKFIDEDRNIIAERKRDIFEGRRRQQTQAATTFADHIERIPFYGLLLIISIIIILIYGPSHFGRASTYWMFVLGGIVYLIVFITQVPMQRSFVQNTILPAMQSGQSIYGLSLVPAAVTGIVQQTLKLLPIALGTMLFRDKRIALLGVGAIVGCGFGFVEAAYVAGPMFQAKTLTSAIFVERLATMLFQTALGAFIGYGFDRGRWWLFWIGAIVIQTIATYLIVFVQSDTMTVEALRTILIVAFLALFGLSVVLQYMRKRAVAVSSSAKRSAKQTSGKKRR